MRALLLLLALVSPAFGQATPGKFLLPGLTGVLAGTGWTSPTVANTLYCWTVPAPLSITNATKLAAYLSNNQPGTNISFAIYPDNDAGTVLAFKTGGAVQGVFSATGLTPFSLTAGTLYRLCHCAATGNIVAYMEVNQSQTCCQDVPVTALIQAFHPTYLGTAANSCTAGTAALPATTGALTADIASPGRAAKRIPILLVEQ